MSGIIRYKLAACAFCHKAVQVNRACCITAMGQHRCSTACNCNLSQHFACMFCCCRAFKAIEWTLIRPLVNVHGYAMYITVFYIISGVTLTTIALTVWVALVLKGSDTANPWLRRWEYYVLC